MTRVLYIEDEPADRMTMRRMLTEAPREFIADFAATFDDGLGLARERRWDVVVLDVVLPGATNVAKDIARVKSACECPLIVLTGMDDPTGDLASVCRRVGADEFLLKHDDQPRLLLSAIDALLPE